MGFTGKNTVFQLVFIANRRFLVKSKTTQPLFSFEPKLDIFKNP
jgi:hypothetical protein